MDRRNFIKTAGLVMATVAASDSQAQELEPKREFVGMLVDTTRCIGCRSCEVACAKTHNLYVPDVENDNALEAPRETSEKQWSIVNRYETEKGPAYAKKQCMHCWQPACAAACLTNAMFKTKEGPVIWRADKCMGCRYCMISCPFNIPKFEFRGWNPKIQKCNMCWERLQEGKKPACSEACPTDALMFGMKREVTEIARVRIYNHPDKYTHKIYGEQEVGGTGWLYLASVPFGQLDFRGDLGETPYPEFTKEFLYSVPAVLMLWPPLLLGLNYLSEENGNGDKESR